MEKTGINNDKKYNYPSMEHFFENQLTGFIVSAGEDVEPISPISGWCCG